MEKICIVKRRKRDYFSELEGGAEGDKGRPGECLSLPVRPASIESQGATKKVVSLPLTPEQASMIRSRGELSPGRACIVDMETALHEKDLVILNFRLTPLYGGRMLSPKDVCRMLQVSKESLRKLVKTHRIDSYRIGNLRRFLLEDVLYYLSQQKEEFLNKESDCTSP